ncbi:MAG TPA: Clp protease N-terminal domain-containing protein, partial [Candidatus Acidoferrales bacterium]|nr:Clp protease N-terminal domain-containing protein [Candidatus Acidoferrales bacterium]
MNADRMTQRVQEALNSAYTRALAEHNPQTTPEHLLAALLDQDEGIAPAILEKANVDAAALRRAVDAAIGRLPRLSGSNADNAQVTVSPGIPRVFTQAESEAKQLGDEYTSVEHLLLALVDANTDAAKVLRDAGVTRDKLLVALRAIRGNQRVTTQNPEGTYQTLERYGRDLTKAAAQGKLDPVIGRDDEIRRVIQVLSRRTKNNP